MDACICMQTERNLDATPASNRSRSVNLGLDSHRARLLQEQQTCWTIPILLVFRWFIPMECSNSASPTSPPKPSVTVTHLSADATFLLSYIPIHPQLQSAVPSTNTAAAPFTLLLDPWLVGSSPVFHPSFSTQSHTTTPSITHLNQLQKSPDIILISQDKSDHCNEETLSQLDICPGGRDENVRVFAVRGAAGKVKGWFGKGKEGKVVELRDWKRTKREDGVVRVEIPVGTGCWEGGTIEAYVEITDHRAIYQWEFPSLHSALGIRFVTMYTPTITVTTSPSSPIRHTHLTIFTPHGVPPSGILPYLTHLSLPPQTPIIDLLLHPFTLTTTPPHLGGKITLGVPNIAKLLKSGVGVRVVASAHDEKKEVGGYVSSRIKTRRWGREEAEEGIWRAVLSEVEGEGKQRKQKGDIGEEDGMVDGEMLPEVWDMENGESRECIF